MVTCIGNGSSEQHVKKDSRYVLLMLITFAATIVVASAEERAPVYMDLVSDAERQGGLDSMRCMAFLPLLRGALDIRIEGNEGVVYFLPDGSTEKSIIGKYEEEEVQLVVSRFLEWCFRGLDSGDMSMFSRRKIEIYLNNGIHISRSAVGLDTEGILLLLKKLLYVDRGIDRDSDVFDKVCGIIENGYK